MPFSALMKDKVILIKKDGAKVPGLRASVQRTKIFMDAGKLVIEAGDLVLRQMSTGAEETYEVLDPGFYEAFGGIPANYQMQVRKLGAPEANRAMQSITYNISGPNARINQHSIDNSVNTVTIDARAVTLVNKLRKAVGDLDIPEAERQEAMDMVDAVQAQVESGKPKKSVVSALLAALPYADNVASIAASLMELLK